MPQKTLLEDGNGKVARFKQGTVAGDPVGLVTYAADYREYVGAAIPLVNSSGSSEMAINGAAGGTPDNVYIDSPTTNWTNSALSGTWDFASTAITPQGGTHSIDATATVDGSQAQMARSSSISMSGYSSITGYIYLTSFNTSRHSIRLGIRSSGTPVGNTVLINSYINTAVLNAWQKFTIPKADLGLSAQSINQLVFTNLSTSGNASDFYLDTINIEETGGTLFTATIPPNVIFELFSINYMFRDNITTIEPNQIMGVSALTNGIVIRTQRNGVTTFGAGVKTFAELMAAGAQLDSQIIGATESAVNFIAYSPAWTRLNGNTKDRFSFLISDDLSGLSSFRAILRGRILV